MMNIIIHHESYNPACVTIQNLMQFAQIHAKSIKDNNTIIIDKMFCNKIFSNEDICNDNNLITLFNINIGRATSFQEFLGPLDEYIKQNSNGKPDGVLVMKGLQEVKQKDTKIETHKFSEYNELRKYYLYILNNFIYEPQIFIEDCSQIFDKLYFREGIHKELNDFSIPFCDIKNKLVDIFDKLENWDEWVNKHPAGNEFENVIRPYLGYSCSREHRETLTQQQTIRTFRINNHNILFNWHIKIHEHIDRIYFAPEDKYRSITNKIIIGKFNRHW